LAYRTITPGVNEKRWQRYRHVGLQLAVHENKAANVFGTIPLRTRMQNALSPAGRAPISCQPAGTRVFLLIDQWSLGQSKRVKRSQHVHVCQRMDVLVFNRLDTTSNQLPGGNVSKTTDVVKDIDHYWKSCHCFVDSGNPWKPSTFRSYLWLGKRYQCT